MPRQVVDQHDLIPHAVENQRIDAPKVAADQRAYKARPATPLGLVRVAVVFIVNYLSQRYKKYSDKYFPYFPLSRVRGRAGEGEATHSIPEYVAPPPP